MNRYGSRAADLPGYRQILRPFTFQPRHRIECRVRLLTDNGAQQCTLHYFRVLPCASVAILLFTSHVSRLTVGCRVRSMHRQWRTECTLHYFHVLPWPFFFSRFTSHVSRLTFRMQGAVPCTGIGARSAPYVNACYISVFFRVLPWPFFFSRLTLPERAPGRIFPWPFRFARSRTPVPISNARRSW